MPEIKVDEAKKDLRNVLDKEKAVAQKKKEEQMPEAEKQKLQEDRKKAEEARIAAEAKAKKEAELLTKKDEEITDPEEKKLKVELLEKQRKAEEDRLSPDEKIKRIEEKTQKRIDEISNKLKEVEDKSSKEAQSLRKELEITQQEKKALEEKISKPDKQDDINVLVEKEEEEKRGKYLKDDASLPREKRREMPDEELDEWLLENQREAVAWIQNRELRRLIDKNKNLGEKQRDIATKSLFEKQQQSFAKVLIRHPEIDIKKRKEELIAQGKSEDEAVDILRQENKKYDLLLKISDEHKDWRFKENAPELVMAEMEKRLNVQEPEKKPDADDEQTKRIEVLEAELAQLKSGDEGISSTSQTIKDKKKQLSDVEKSIIETMKTAKATQPMIDSAIKKFRERQGVK